MMEFMKYRFSDEFLAENFEYIKFLMDENAKLFRASVYSFAALVILLQAFMLTQ
jgi:hypothetical protein